LEKRGVTDKRAAEKRATRPDPRPKMTRHSAGPTLTPETYHYSNRLNTEQRKNKAWLATGSQENDSEVSCTPQV